MTSGTPAARPTLDEAATAKASYARCCEAADFFVCFYHNLFQQSPEIEPMFANTDFSRQHRLLKHALGLLLAFPHQPDGDTSILERVADRHGRHDLKIKPALYAGWVSALIRTVREHDAEFSPAVEAAWRRTLAPGIAFMQERYEPMPRPASR